MFVVSSRKKNFKEPQFVTLPHQLHTFFFFQTGWRLLLKVITQDMDIFFHSGQKNGNLKCTASSVAWTNKADDHNSKSPFIMGYWMRFPCVLDFDRHELMDVIILLICVFFFSCFFVMQNRRN